MKIVCEWIQTQLSRWQSDVDDEDEPIKCDCRARCALRRLRLLFCRAKVRAREQLSNWALSPSEERCSMFHLAGSWPWLWHHRPFIWPPRTGPCDLYVDIMVCIHRDCSVTTMQWFLSLLNDANYYYDYCSPLILLGGLFFNSALAAALIYNLGVNTEYRRC